MSEWHRAIDWLECGADPHCRVRPGEPYMLLKSGRCRCQTHAAEPVGEIHERPISQKTPEGFCSARELAKAIKRPLRFDARRAASGDTGE
jgi:hypothetical protein